MGGLELHRWTLLVAGIAYWANVVRTSPPIADASGLAFALDSVLAHGAFCVAAWAMIAVLLRRPPAAECAAPASRVDYALALTSTLLCIVPARQTAIAALLVLGLAFAFRPRARALRPIGVMLLCLAGEMIWSSTYALPLHAMVARLDAIPVRALLGLAGIPAAAHGNIVRNIGQDFDIEILGTCASSFPLAGVVLAFVVVTIHQGRLPRRRDLPWLGASLLASIVLTEFRLAGMSLSPGDYQWLHNGGGVSAYAFVAALLAGGFALLATGRAA